MDTSTWFLITEWILNNPVLTGLIIWWLLSTAVLTKVIFCNGSESLSSVESTFAILLGLFALSPGIVSYLIALLMILIISTGIATYEHYFENDIVCQT